MKLNVLQTKGIEIFGMKLTNIKGETFMLNDNEKRIIFTVSGENGKLKKVITSVYYKLKNREYYAHRYTKKFTTIVNDVCSFLAINNYVWDYGINKPFLVAYKTRIENDYKSLDSYYKKCIENGMSTIKDVNGKDIYTYPTFEQYYAKRIMYIM